MQLLTYQILNRFNGGCQWRMLFVSFRSAFADILKRDEFNKYDSVYREFEHFDVNKHLLEKLT